MRHRMLPLLPIVLGVINMPGCTPKKSSEPVILIAAFGSSYERGLGNLADFDRAVRSAFPGNEIYWGFSASFIVKKLQNLGIKTLFDSQVPLLDIEQALSHLRALGKSKVLVVNFLIMRGAEYRQILNTPTAGLNVKYVHPILYYEESIQNTVMALEDLIADGKETATIFCAHGNGRDIQYNIELELLDEYLKRNYQNAYLVSLEGTPSWPPVRDAVLGSGVNRVRFVTFMLTSGDHMANDVMGESPESFRRQLGLSAESTDGLASIPEFQRMFIDRMHQVMAQFEGM
ncbi:MAG: hypothetical protein B6D68_00410 [spirochete symbiont of Stewartia floridana]|nr:MAG: hypothetical protein B6D68_00410 [spirochete symbiont of Stewartia floridana]